MKINQILTGLAIVAMAFTACQKEDINPSVATNMSGEFATSRDSSDTDSTHHHGDHHHGHSKKATLDSLSAAAQAYVLANIDTSTVHHYYVTSNDAGVIIYVITIEGGAPVVLDVDGNVLTLDAGFTHLGGHGHGHGHHHDGDNDGDDQDGDDNDGDNQDSDDNDGPGDNDGDDNDGPCEDTAPVELTAADLPALAQDWMAANAATATEVEVKQVTKDDCTVIYKVEYTLDGQHKHVKFDVDGNVL